MLSRKKEKRERAGKGGRREEGKGEGGKGRKWGNECYFQLLWPWTPSSISPNPTKKLRICANPVTQHGRGMVGTDAHPCPPVATLLHPNIVKFHNRPKVTLVMFYSHRLIWSNIVQNLWLGWHQNRMYYYA